MQDADIIDGTVVGVGKDLLDALHDVETLGDLAKDGVLAIEMGRATHLAVGPEHLGGDVGSAIGGLFYTLLDGLEVLGGVGLTPDDIELATTGATLRVHPVALASHGQGATTMVVLGGAELGHQGIVQLASAQRGAWLGMTTRGVAALDHKTLDDAMKEERVVELLVDQLEEVVAMDGGVVVEHHADVALGGLEQHFVALCLAQRRDGEHEQKNDGFLHDCLGVVISF